MNVEEPAAAVEDKVAPTDGSAMDGDNGTAAPAPDSQAGSDEKPLEAAAEAHSRKVMQKLLHRRFLVRSKCPTARSVSLLEKLARQSGTCKGVRVQRCKSLISPMWTQMPPWP